MGMKTRQESLNYDEFAEWKRQTWFSYANRMLEGKRFLDMRCYLDGRIVVWLAGTTVYEGYDARVAIEAFNKILGA